jgi:hypothetical protein
MDMELSVLLARTIGLLLMLVAIALLVNRKNIDLLFEIYSHTAAVFITGILETVVGLALAIGHNVWTLDFRLIITAIGWILLIRGVGRIFYPSHTTKMLEKFKKFQSIFVLLLIFVFLAGAYLAYMGFTR